MKATAPLSGCGHVEGADLSGPTRWLRRKSRALCIRSIACSRSPKTLPEVCRTGKYKLLRPLLSSKPHDRELFYHNQSSFWPGVMDRSEMRYL